jgi:polysaccharide deacetylase family protein (PEP-CTERM system associated)
MIEKKSVLEGPGGPDRIWNALTVDVEDYFMVTAFAGGIKCSDWPLYECRVERNTHRILELMAQYGVKGTFFVLGWIGENYGSLVRDIQAAGHEIACHGYNHRLIYDLTKDEFREDVRKAKTVLEDITGTPVFGYRATSYSIVKETLWALDILAEEGFRYDSSIFPVHHDLYGVPGAQRFFHTITTKAGEILEIPPTTFKLFGQNIPVAGGGYFRLYPLRLTKAIIRRINMIEKKAAVIYVHPWEIDVDQPRLNGGLLSKFRHYVNLRTTEQKLEDCMKEFRFKPISEVFNVSAKAGQRADVPVNLHSAAAGKPDQAPARPVADAV